MRSRAAQRSAVAEPRPRAPKGVYPYGVGGATTEGVYHVVGATGGGSTIGFANGRYRRGGLPPKVRREGGLPFRRKGHYQKRSTPAPRKRSNQKGALQPEVGATTRRDGAPRSQRSASKKRRSTIGRGGTTGGGLPLRSSGRYHLRGILQGEGQTACAV